MCALDHWNNHSSYVKHRYTITWRNTYILNHAVAFQMGDTCVGYIDRAIIIIFRIDTTSYCQSSCNGVVSCF